MSDQQKPYLVTKERKIVVDAPNPDQALLFGEKAFNAYTIAEHPDIQDGSAVVRKSVVENLPMYLNLADSETVIGVAQLWQDELTGQYHLDIRMMDHAVTLMDNLIEIADIKAVGFAGIMKKPEAL